MGRFSRPSQIGPKCLFKNLLDKPGFRNSRRSGLRFECRVQLF